MLRRAAWLTVVTGVACLLLTACTPGPEPSGDPEPAGTTPTPPTPRSCPTAPPFESTDGTAFGTSLSTRTVPFAEALQSRDAAYTRMSAVRIFDPGVPPHGAWARRGPLLADRTIITSFRVPPAEIVSGRHDHALLHFLRTAPRDVPVFWSYYHEPEGDIDDGLFTLADYRAAWQHVARLAARTCRANLHPTLILTGYTTEPESGRDWRDYYPGDEFISAVAFDPYNSASSRPEDYPPPDELFRPVLRAATDSGKPWGIAETGSQVVDSDPTGRQRAAWLADIADYFRSHGAAFVTYYDSVGVSGADYRLTDEPSRTAWREVVQDSAP